MDIRDNVFSFLQDWYGRRDDILEDLEDNGFDVLEANAEYMVVEKDGKQYDMRLGGTSSTITIDKIECVMEEGLSPITEKLSKADIEKEIIDCVGMGFETGHIVYDEFSEFEKEVGPGVEEVNDPNMTVEDAWNFYNELINMGPGGFYDEYHDRYDFSKDFINEYGKDEYESNQEDDLIEIENGDEIFPEGNYKKGKVYSAPEGPKVIWNVLVTGTIDGESFNQYFTAWREEDIRDYLSDKYPTLEIDNIDKNRGSYELEKSGKLIIDLTGTKTESLEPMEEASHPKLGKRVKSLKGWKIYQGTTDEGNEIFRCFTPDDDRPAVGYEDWECETLEQAISWVEHYNDLDESLIPIITEDVKEGVKDENESLVFLHLDNIAELASNYEELDKNTLRDLIKMLEDEMESLKKVYIELQVGIKRYTL